jgi:hypothetical protein
MIFVYWCTVAMQYDLTNTTKFQDEVLSMHSLTRLISTFLIHRHWYCVNQYFRYNQSFDKIVHPKN